MRRLPLLLLFSLSSSSPLAGCGAETTGDSAQADDANQTSQATIKLTGDFETRVSGAITAGKPVRVDYALDRLPQCRGNASGGPGWTITGFFSENGGAPKTFEVSKVSGAERVAAPATITPSQGGDLAMWFQVTNRWGCSEFDSAFGQNFHFDVRGPEPATDARIVFAEDGSVAQDGTLKAGGKVRVRYEQDRLPACRRTHQGNPVWSITGFAQTTGSERPHTFDTGRAENGDRVPVEAVLDLPAGGELTLWFQVVSLGGCMEYDSNRGSNYRFRVE